MLAAAYVPRTMLLKPKLCTQPPCRGHSAHRQRRPCGQHHQHLINLFTACTAKLVHVPHHRPMAHAYALL